MKARVNAGLVKLQLGTAIHIMPVDIASASYAPFLALYRKQTFVLQVAHYLFGYLW